MRARIHLSEHFTYGKLLRFTLSPIAMNIFTSLYIIVDGYFVANYVGKTGFAAINLIMPVLNILGTTGYMFGVGGSALIAKTLGEKEKEKADRLFSLIILASFSLGVLMLVPGFIFMPWIAAMLGAEGKLLEYSILYGRIFILALPAWILAYSFQLFFVTAEKPRLGLVVTVCAGLCNIALDMLFIIVFQWGLAEAAFSFVGTIYNVQLLKYAGEDGVVIYGLLMYVSLIFSAIFVGYSNGAGPVFSYHYGAQNHTELKNLRIKSLVIIGLTSVIMFILSEVLAYPFSILFLKDTGQLLSDTVHAFQIFSFAYLFTGMAIFGSGFFTALNNGQISALISFLRTFVFELGAVLFLPVLLGADGIWCSAVFAELMAAVAGTIFMAALQRRYHY